MRGGTRRRAKTVLRGSGKKRDGQAGCRSKDKQQERPARGRDKKPEDDDHEEDDESGDQEFQKAT